MNIEQTIRDCPATRAETRYRNSTDCELPLGCELQTRRQESSLTPS
jgi:hypothetical protein